MTTRPARKTGVAGHSSGTRGATSCQRHSRQRSALNQTYPLRRRVPSRSRPQKAMRTRAHVLTPSNNTIASSMIESLRWCHQKHARRSRNCHLLVPASVGTKPFSRADENVLKQRPAYLVVNKQGRPTCSSSSGSSTPSKSGRPVNDRALSSYPCLGQRGHLRRPRAGRLPHGLGSQHFVSRAAGVGSAASYRRRNQTAGTSPGLVLNKPDPYPRHMTGRLRATLGFHALGR